MLPLAAQPAAHCSTTRIRSCVFEPGHLLAALAAAVVPDAGFEQQAVGQRRRPLAPDTRDCRNRDTPPSPARASRRPTASARRSTRRRLGRRRTCGTRCPRTGRGAALARHLLVPEHRELVARRGLRRQAQRGHAVRRRVDGRPAPCPPRRSTWSDRRRWRWRTCRARVRSLPSSRNVPKNHSRSGMIGPPTPRLKSHTLRVSPGVRQAARRAAPRV